MADAHEEVDAELARWRDRLAAASRNVSELSELPEFAVARATAKGAGRAAEEARGLIATMDELWQGVLLIGSALDRAEEARKATGRLWRTEASAREALDILRGPSIAVDLSDTPVLHRRLLAGPRATATVSPETLLQTMEAAFDKARACLTRLTDAGAQAASLRARLAASVVRLPSPDAMAARLAAADLPDALDRLDALEALAPEIDASAAQAERAGTGLAAARQALSALQAEGARAAVAAEACRAAVAAPLPPADEARLAELADWLDGIGRTLGAGRVQAAQVGLANWRALHDRLAGDVRALSEAVAKITARAEDLRARLGALRVKHRAAAQPSPALASLEAAAKAASSERPVDLEAAARAVAAYEAALSARAAP